MIVTNCFAHLIVWLAGKITKGTKGVTLWPFIFIWPAWWSSVDTLVKHERKHLEQYKHFWIVGFLPVYVYYHLKYGYQNNPLEVEARQ